MISGPARSLLAEIWSALDGPPAALDHLELSGAGALPSAYPVTALAVASIGAAALALAELVPPQARTTPQVVVDRRLASLWFGWSIRPLGWRLPAVWDALAGDYRTGDGWIKLHTNARRHREAALRVLGPHPDKVSLARAVASWSATDLETAIVDAGGCAAELRSPADWLAHPQGRAVAKEPLIDQQRTGLTRARQWGPRPERPLAGIKVLDLTRVLAGPVAGRFLAGYGAEVLRIDPPDWDEPGVIPEVALGKRCARLDLTHFEERNIFEKLLSQADLLLHGYRPGALDALGYGREVRRSTAPDLIEVTLDAYGWTGPWSGRRGFDSLVQMSTGIAHRGMEWKGADAPTPLPVQALDNATGYLMAAAAICGLRRRVREREASAIRVSLARTATLLKAAQMDGSSESLAPPDDNDFSPEVEQTTWGDARRLRPPVSIADAPMRWRYPARALGSSPAEFPSDG